MASELIFFVKMCKIVAGRGTTNFNRKNNISEIPSTSGAICEKPQGPFASPASGEWRILLGGGAYCPLPVISQTARPISKMPTPFATILYVF